MMLLNANENREIVFRELNILNEKVRQAESITSQYLYFFFIIFLAYSSFIATGLFSIFMECKKAAPEHNFIPIYNLTHTSETGLCQEQIKILNFFDVSPFFVAIIIFSGLIVFLISYSILLIVTKTSHTKTFSICEIKKIRKTIYEDTSFPYLQSYSSFFNMLDRQTTSLTVIEDEKHYVNRFMRRFLSIRSLSKIVVCVYIHFLFLFSLYIFVEQIDYAFYYASVPISTKLIFFELLAIFVEGSFIIFYVICHCYILNTDINKMRRDGSKKKKAFFWGFISFIFIAHAIFALIAKSSLIKFVTENISNMVSNNWCLYLIIFVLIACFTYTLYKIVKLNLKNKDLQKKLRIYEKA